MQGTAALLGSLNVRRRKPSFQSFACYPNRDTWTWPFSSYCSTGPGKGRNKRKSSALFNCQTKSFLRAYITPLYHNGGVGWRLMKECPSPNCLTAYFEVCKIFFEIEQRRLPGASPALLKTLTQGEILVPIDGQLNSKVFIVFKAFRDKLRTISSIT